MADLNLSSLVLPTLGYLDPFEVTNSEECGFLWLADILNSGYPEDERHAVASRIIQLLGERFHPGPEQFPSSWIPPLLDFLSICDKLQPAEGLTALRILLSGRRYSDFGARILPVLTSVLLLTHPLQSRVLAIRGFCRFAAGWFSPEMENILHEDLDKFLQAVGDPFQFLDHSLQDGQSVDMGDYESMEATIILIEFASSDLWRDHLCRPNFSSCEGILSTEEGKETALSHMFDTATNSRPEFLCTPVKVIAAIKRLEELQCMNTAETVLLWSWTANVMATDDRGAWGLIERGTLDFYRTHGIFRLTALSRHITNKTMETVHIEFLLKRYGDQFCQVGSVRQPISIPQVRQRSQHFEDLRVAQVCQLRRLYHLFGYDPATWKDAVAVDEVDGGTDMLSVRLVTPTQFTDWTCDYP